MRFNVEAELGTQVRVKYSQNQELPWVQMLWQKTQRQKNPVMIQKISHITNSSTI